MKKLFVSLVVFILVIFTITSQSLRNTQFLNPVSNRIQDGDKSIIKTFNYTNIDETSICAEIVFYEDYNSAIFRFTIPNTMKYDEGDIEVMFKHLVETWIKDQGHRYYTYIVANRKSFFSRNDKDGNKVTIKEFKVYFGL